MVPKEKTEKTASEPAMSPQQRQVASNGKLKTYRELVIGDESLAHFLGYECYQTFLSNLPGLLGYGLRGLAISGLLAQPAKGLVLGRSVNIRQPKKIALGKGVAIDDFASLDVKSSHNKQAGIEIGDSALIGRHSSIVARDAKIILGRACNISSHCRLGSTAGITIGESVLIAAYVYIGPGNHRVDDLDTPIMEQGMEEGQGVVIGNNVWIGTKATILDGVTIGDNAIIGAHALVKDNVPAGAIVAGTPAKILRMR